MRSGGRSFGRVSLHVGTDWRTCLSTYPQHTPILDVDAGSTSVAFCIDGSDVTKDAVEFADELAGQAARFAAEVRRLHGLNHDAAPGRGAGDSEAAP